MPLYCDSSTVTVAQTIRTPQRELNKFGVKAQFIRVVSPRDNRIVAKKYLLSQEIY